jgi:AraC-like DNA-binding protein
MKFDAQIDYYKKDGLVFSLGQKLGVIDVPHDHEDTYQFEYLLGGSAIDIGTQGSSLMTPGTINIFNPSDPHQVDYRMSNSFFFFAPRQIVREILQVKQGVAFEPIFASKMAHRPRFPRAIYNDLVKHLQTTSEYLLQNPNDQTIAVHQEDQTYSLLSLLLHDLTPNIKPTAELIPQTQIRLACEYLANHYQNAALKLNDIAKTAGLSTYHFSRLFRRVTGMSPIAYLTDIRIGRAKQLLKTTKLRLIDIALEVGFQSENQLCYHFKKLTGMTAGDFRK